MEIAVECVKNENRLWRNNSVDLRHVSGEGTSYKKPHDPRNDWDLRVYWSFHVSETLKKKCSFASSSYDATKLRYYQMGRRSEEAKNETEIGEEGRNWSDRVINFWEKKYAFSSLSRRNKKNIHTLCANDTRLKTRTGHTNRPGVYFFTTECP